jgi:prolyl-tRNA editing enzyme YbaK/EbsC (Cys-tRNA(Pro) deacylase)
MQVLSPKHVQQVLDSFNLGLKSVQYNQPTATSELAAAAIGCKVAQIAKSMCFMVKKIDPILVVASGSNTVDDRKLSKLLEVGRSKVRFAKPEQCIEFFGYAPGGVPPVGHRTEGIRIFLDTDLQQYERIWAAGGTANINFGLSPDQLQQITRGTWVDVTKD